MQTTNIRPVNFLPTKCPLGHPTTQCIEIIQTVRLAVAYRVLYDIDVAPMFAGLDEFAFCRCDHCGLGFFSPPRAGSAEFYTALSRIPWYYEVEKEEYGRAAKRISPGQRVLEIGCGRGAFARYLQQAAYIGLEFNPAAIAAAREQAIDVRNESIQSFSQDNKDGFDVVCAFQVLEHVPDPAQFITACVTCARPGALVLFGVPNSSSFVGAQPDNLLNLPPHHLTWWDEPVFWKIAPEFGLEVVSVEMDRLAPGHRGLYIETVALRALMRRMRIRRAFFFEGWRYRLMKFIARMAKPPLRIALNDERLLPFGPTILAVLRKG
jgi:SAM-dependent methyltransferase